MNKDLQKFVSENPKLVKKRATSNPDLFVLKYQRSVFYKNQWNEFLEECRGTVIDNEFNLILENQKVIRSNVLLCISDNFDQTTRLVEVVVFV